jgi:hypothetical protein
LKSPAMKIRLRRSALRAFRWDRVWLPAGFWILFALIILFVRTGAGWQDVARGYLGALLPLTAGILSAYAILDDPALEIVFSTPLSAARHLAGRLMPILLITIVAAVSFQGFLRAAGLDGHGFGDPVSFQLSWLVPSLTLSALGVFASLAVGQGATGGLTVGLVWILQLIARDWFISRGWAGHILIFLGLFRPGDPRLAANRIVLLLLTAALLAAAWRLLARQERYL